MSLSELSHAQNIALEGLGIKVGGSRCKGWVTLFNDTWLIYDGVFKYIGPEDAPPRSVHDIYTAVRHVFTNNVVLPLHYEWDGPMHKITPHLYGLNAGWGMSPGSHTHLTGAAIRRSSHRNRFPGGWVNFYSLGEHADAMIDIIIGGDGGEHSVTPWWGLGPIDILIPTYVLVDKKIVFLADNGEYRCSYAFDRVEYIDPRRVAVPLNVASRTNGAIPPYDPFTLSPDPVQVYWPPITYTS